MNLKLESILIFVGAITGLIFFIKILQAMLSKPNNLPSEDHNNHLFYDDDLFNEDD